MDVVLVFRCNVQYLHHVEGILKLITVISMHRYALMGLTNGFRIHSNAVYILLRLHYTGHVLLMDCVLISNVMNARFLPHRFVFHQPSAPLISHTNACMRALRFGLRCLDTAITLSGCFFLLIQMAP